MRIPLPSLLLLCLISACGSGSTDPAPQELDAGTGTDASPSGADAAPRNGDLRFTVNGREVVAERIRIEESSGYYTITASRDEDDSFHFEQVSIQFDSTGSGSAPCGSILGLPDRTVSYGRYFFVNGQVATDKQFLSGLPTQPNCTFEILGHDPESGEVTGPLASDKVLTGGTPDPSIQITIEWSGIEP